MVRQVTCISKDNGHHEDLHLVISHLNWKDENGKFWRSTRLQMVEFVERDGIAYVEDRFGVAKLIVRKSSWGNKYVKTISDGRETDNLLNLPEC